MEEFTNLDPNNLVIFYFVATEKSLTAAADKLHLTQPAITYHIKLLEEYTRVKLIEFKKHQVILTPPGKEVFKYAQEIFQQKSLNMETESWSRNTHKHRKSRKNRL